MGRVMLGVIGGAGLGEALGALGGGRAEEVETPFGHPSGPITVTEISGVPVALLSRHGEGHLLNPSRVPYRANIFAMKVLGGTHILASGAVGSLREGAASGGRGGKPAGGTGAQDARDPGPGDRQDVSASGRFQRRTGRSRGAGFSVLLESSQPPGEERGRARRPCAPGRNL